MTGPRVKPAEPVPVHLAQQPCGEACVGCDALDVRLLGSHKCVVFSMVHVTLATDALQIAQHSASRPRLELRVDTLSNAVTAWGCVLGHCYVIFGCAQEMAERQGLVQAVFAKRCRQLWLRVNSNDDKELHRLIDVLFLHGFLPSRNAF